MQSKRHYNDISWRSIARHYATTVREHIGSQVAILLSYGAGGIIASIVVPVLYKHIVEAVTVRDAGALTSLDTLIILLVAALIVDQVLFRIGDYFMITSQSSMLKELTDYALTKLEGHSYDFFASSFTGGLVAKVKRFISAFETLHDLFMFQLWLSSIMLLASLATLSYFSLVLGGIYLVWLIVYSGLVVVLVRYMLPKSLAMAESDSKVTGRLSDIITNILSVKLFGARERELASFAEATEDQRSKRRSAWMQMSFWNSLWQGSAIVFFEIVLVVTVIALAYGDPRYAGLIVLVVLYMLQSADIVWNLSKNVTRIAGALTDAQEMTDIFETQVGVRDLHVPEPLTIGDGRIDILRVSHDYAHGASTFSNLTLSIAPGERVALVGRSGAGKSTLTKLLLRFIEPTEGQILIDGQDIARVRQDELRRAIAYVPQEPLLFHRTLYENIAYGRQHATRDEVMSAAARAHAHEFISRLPNGYDTEVGERGVKLSGGERQRVAIARALLTNAPIVILDEATSSLDSVSERVIQDAFDELMRGRTTIVIAHRLSTIRHMDRIIVLEAGAVQEEGTHEALLEHNGIYAALWNSQVGGFIRDEDADAEPHGDAAEDR